MVNVQKPPVVFVVGAFPEPVHGLANVNEAMAVRLAARGNVVRFDTALAARARSPWRRAVARLSLLLLVPKLAALVLLRRPTAVYIGLSGGAGQALDGLLAAVARCWAIPVFVHHHSFRYINHRSRLAGAVLRIVDNATHVTLCEEMAKRLQARYPKSVRNLFVLPNAALFSTAFERIVRAHKGQPLTVGFLSNITREKGIFTFFAILDRLAHKGVAVRAVIAGPVAARISVEFSQALAGAPNATHIGAVHGDQKSRFFDAVDLLVFPSHYENEADPLTIAEAIGAGVPVVASDKGCIAAALGYGAGVHFPDDEQLVDNMARFISRVTASSELYDSLALAAANASAHRNAEQQAALDALLGTLTRTK